MLVRNIMRHPILSIPVTANVRQAACVMREHDVGALAVVRDGQLIGIITDRDIVTRCVATGKSDEMHEVTEFMTENVITCFDHETIETASAKMGDHQIRRLPVLDDVNDLAGMLTVDGIAEEYCEKLAGETLGEIVESR